jgi:hypothetical protein
VAIFQNPLWGFELTYPDGWVHKSYADTDGFAKNIDAFNQVGAVNELAAHLLVRGEWNGRREPIAAFWNQHITKLSVMLGAKKLGAAPFSMGGAMDLRLKFSCPNVGTAACGWEFWRGIRLFYILWFRIPKKSGPILSRKPRKSSPACDFWIALMI